MAGSPEINLSLDQQIKIILDFLEGKNINIPPEFGTANKQVLTIHGDVVGKLRNRDSSPLSQDTTEIAPTTIFPAGDTSR
jgi:hypothetical protein